MPKYILSAVIAIALIAGGAFYISNQTSEIPIATQPASAEGASAMNQPEQELPATTSKKIVPLAKDRPLQNVLEGNPRTGATTLMTTGTPYATSVTATSMTDEPTGGISIPVKVGDKTYDVRVPEGSEVIDAIIAAKNLGLTYDGREFMGLGLRVDEINGVRSKDGFYWFLYINDRSSDFGASQMTLKAGDTVEWRYKQGY